jgi:branched-chain amino acid transport system permease protein
MLLTGFINGIIMGGVLSLPVLGVAVVYGITGIPNFAIGLIGVFGGFVTWYFLSYNMVLALFVGVAVCFPIGYLLQKILLTPISNKGGDAIMFFVITISLGFVFEGLIKVIFPRPSISIALPHLGSFNIGGVTVEIIKLLALIFALSTLTLIRLLEIHTRPGQSWQATSRNLKLAKLVGVNTDRVFAVAHGIGCSLACIGAIFWGSLYNLNVLSGWELGFLGFIIAVVGGIGNIWGGMLSAMLMGMILSYSGYFLDGNWQSVILYAIVILVLIVSPKGILGSERSL